MIMSRNQRDAEAVKCCSQCREEKPATSQFFYRMSIREKTVLVAYCKECAKKYRKKPATRLIGRPAQSVVIEEGYKLCCRCKKQKLATKQNFSPSKRSKDGFHRTCKKCVVEVDEIYRTTDAYRLWRDEIGSNRKAYMRSYRQNNLERLQKYHEAYCEKRRLQKLQASFNRAKILFPAYEYFHGYCAVCNERLREEMKVTAWRPDDSSIVIALCDSCITSKGCLQPEQWLIQRYGKREAKKILDRLHDYFLWLKETGL